MVVPHVFINPRRYFVQTKVVWCSHSFYLVLQVHMMCYRLKNSFEIKYKSCG